MNSVQETIFVFSIFPITNKSESPVTKKSALPSTERLNKKLSFGSLHSLIFDSTFINSPKASIWVRSVLISDFLKNLLNLGLSETSKNSSSYSCEKISVTAPDSRRTSNSFCLLEIKKLIHRLVSRITLLFFIPGFADCFNLFSNFF